jgi:hypothetical protein
MVDKNDPLLREVDEELRREQLAKLWERYGIHAIAAAALIVVLVGGFKYWESRQAALAEEGGAKYEAALGLVESAKTDAATKALEEIVGSGAKGYATLANLVLAGSAVKAARPKDALAIYERLAQDGAADELLASFAALQAAALRLGEADYAEMKARLTPLTTDDSAWRYNARELLGTAALKAGKLGEARAAFEPLLADPSVPEGTLERVRIMMADLATTELGQGAGKAPAPAPQSADSGPAKN